MDFSDSWNNNLAENILLWFKKNIAYLSNFDLDYRVSNFFNKDIDLSCYNHKNKDYIFYIDKYWVETHFSVYNACDDSDYSNWIVFEFIIWNKKELIYFSDNKVYNILENKWWWIIESGVIENLEKISDTLEFVNNENNYLYNKSLRYRTRLRERWVLNKYISEYTLEKFRLDFKNNVLNLA